MQVSIQSVELALLGQASTHASMQALVSKHASEQACKSSKHARPMLYPGRVLMPMDEKAMRDRVAFWKGTDIFVTPVTEGAKLLKAKDLLEIEDLDEA